MYACMYMQVPAAFFHATVGLGNPSALHSILASLPWANALSVGSTIHRGGTIHYNKEQLVFVHPVFRI